LTHDRISALQRRLATTTSCPRYARVAARNRLINQALREAYLSSAATRSKRSVSAGESKNATASFTFPSSKRITQQ
jgi:hypothetical protein